MSLTDHKALIYLKAGGAASNPAYLMCYDFDASAWSELAKPCTPHAGTEDASLIYDHINEIVYLYMTSTADLSYHLYKSTDFASSWAEVPCSPFTHFMQAAAEPQIGISEADGRLYLWGLVGTTKTLGYYDPSTDTITVTDNTNATPVAAAQERTIITSPTAANKIWLYDSATALHYNDNSGDKDSWVTYNLGQAFDDLQPSFFNDSVLYGVSGTQVFKLTNNGSAVTTLATTVGMDGLRIWEDQADSSKLYVGSNSLGVVPQWVSTDGGATWTAATDALTTGKYYNSRQIMGRWGYGDTIASIVQGSTSPESYHVWLAWTSDGSSWSTSKVTGVADWSKIAAVTGPTNSLRANRLVYNYSIVDPPVSPPEPEPPDPPIIPEEPEPPDPPEPPRPVYTPIVRPTSSGTMLVYDETKNAWSVYDGLPDTAVSWNHERRHIVLSGDGVLSGTTDCKALCGLFRYGLNTHMDLVLSFHGLNDVFKYKRVRHVEVQLKGDAKKVEVHWEFDGNEVSGAKEEKVYTAKGRWFGAWAVDSGTSTSVGALTLTDNTQSWTTDEWAGYGLVDEDLDFYTIVSNTATALTLDSGPPASGAYEIVHTSSTIGEDVAYFSDDETGGVFTRPLEKKYRFVCPQGGMGTLARIRVETEGEGEITIERVAINFVMAP